MADRKSIKDLQISDRWYFMLGCCVVLFFVSFFFPILYRLVFTATMLIFFFTIVDLVLLF